MLFAVFDHNDATGLPTARQLDQRLELVMTYERHGYYAYQLAEHHGTPLGIATPHLMLAAASRLTSEFWQLRVRFLGSPSMPRRQELTTSRLNSRSAT
jgi:hypothetical protein